MIIETKQLTKQYNGQGGFKNISLSVGEGEVFGFLGKNGAGKSTFVRTLLGLLQPDGGLGTVLNASIGDVDTRKQIGYLPELFQFQPWLTGRELLYYHGLLYKMDKRTIRKRIPEVLTAVGLNGHENKRIRHYSKGMKQRIGLATALLPDPKLIFFDEPTSALDPIGRKDVREIIMEQKAAGKTVFLNTHLLNEVEMVADRIAIIDSGRLLKTGSVSELSQMPVVIEVGNISDGLLAALKTFDQNLVMAEQPSEVRRFELYAADDRLPELTRTIVEHQADLYSLKRKESILEDLFIRTVEGQKR